MTKGPQYSQIKEIFEKTPIDEFIVKNLSKLPKDIQKKLLQDSKFYSEIGMTTDDPKKYMEMLKKYELDKKALKDINTDIKSDKITKAYPNYESYMYIQPTRDTKKWLQAARDMYYRVHKGLDKVEALARVTSGWDRMEKIDFFNWLKFYEEGAHKKYKTAQVNYWENANRAGYFVPIYPDPPKREDHLKAQDIDNVKNPSTHPDIEADEKRELIEKQRHKIIGRLDSAEKLLRSQEGQMFAGQEFETLIESVYQLKKKIQLVNKLSMSTKLYEDMIVREANILTKKGFIKAAAYLHSVAEAAPAPAEPPGSLSGGGMPGNIPGEGPGLTPESAIPSDTAAPTDPSLEAMPTSATPGLEAGKAPGTLPDADVANPTDVPSKGMDAFLKGLNTNLNTFEDKSDDDDLEVAEDDDITVTVTAQATLPPVLPAPTKQMDPTTEPEIEVTEDQVDNTSIQPSKDFGKMLDTAFTNLTVADIVSHFENLSKLFKVREIPRQLAMADMMLDRLGLAPFFPSLAEATNKSLEANQYIATRVEDILSRLRGTLKTKDIDLKNDAPPPVSQEVKNVKDQLQNETDKEKARKQMRKNIENESLMGSGKAEPEIEVAEDLSQPAELKGGLPPAPPPPPAPIR